MESPYAYFRITEKAGRFVAGRNNTGIGTSVLLSRREAAYDVGLGTLVEVGKAVLEREDDGDALSYIEGGDATFGGAVKADGAIELTKLTAKQLRALAKDCGVAVDDRATKAEIITAIEATI